jgi:hypothetical protein
MLAQGKAKRATAIWAAALGNKTPLLIGRAVRMVYCKDVAEAETEFALFRPNQREFRTPDELSADAKSLSRIPGLRPLGADLPWASIGPPRWGFSCRFAGEVFSHPSPKARTFAVFQRDWKY